MSWPVLVAIVLVPLLIVVLAVRPTGIGQIAAHPRPSKSYAEAIQRVAALQGQEREGYNPLCVTQLLTHGTRTPRAVVLVHGYTSCPQQFVPLGRQFFDRGDNVLIARLPRHGRADRLTAEHAGLQAAELAAHADEVVDIAAGLGERVTMVGLSGGAITTAWAAQNRSDLDRAVIIASAFGYKQIPGPLTVLAMNTALLLLPNIFLWWDPQLKEAIEPKYSYPRYSSRAVMNVLRLGFATRAAAGRRRPAARSIVVVTNAHDDKVDNAAAVRMVAVWRAAGASNVSQYEFPAALKLGHDLIDPNQPNAQPKVVFPKLVELVDGS